MEFFEKNKKISNNTLNEDFCYKDEYHIQSIYTWFSNCELFCFNYKEISDCIICKSHNEIIKYYNPLISIDNEEI